LVQPEFISTVSNEIFTAIILHGDNMIYYIIDVRYPNGYKIVTKLQGKHGKDYLYHFVYQSESIQSIIRSTKHYILKGGGKLKSLDMIRLCGHGNSGYVQLGQGLTKSTAGWFRDLAGFLKPDLSRDGIQIHGCGVGSDTSILGAASTITNPVCIPGSAHKGKGYELLGELANAVKRNVTAGLDCQYVDDDWKFEGPTITVCPGGGYALLSAS
jgi:hypothetical protein